MQAGFAVEVSKHKIVLFGPSLEALSGVSTHVRMLLASDLASDYELLHFQVGSEGRRENALQRIARVIVGPLHFALFLLRTGAKVVHINVSFDLKGYWRDICFWSDALLLGRRVLILIYCGSMPRGFL